MSNERAIAYHPKTGRLEVVTINNLPVEHSFYAAFDDGATCGPMLLREPDPVDLFEIAQEMAEALTKGATADSIEAAADAGVECGEALARWREFTNAKETEK